MSESGYYTLTNGLDFPRSPPQNKHERETIQRLEDRNTELETEVISLRRDLLSKSVVQEEHDITDSKVVSINAVLDENKALISQLLEKTDRKNQDEETERLKLELATREPMVSQDEETERLKLELATREPMVGSDLTGDRIDSVTHSFSTNTFSTTLLSPQVRKLKDRLRKVRYQNGELQGELQRIQGDLQLTEADLKRVPEVETENAVLSSRLTALEQQYAKLVKENGDLRRFVIAHHGGIPPGIGEGGGGEDATAEVNRAIGFNKQMSALT